mmetsp:Transcript_48767/g.115905  ORF Transcript_48767/g.115905 Transcript_48767/m.115905 type:complete len:253 (+) Transcript_48767:650-1408(+)
MLPDTSRLKSLATFMQAMKSFRRPLLFSAAKRTSHSGRHSPMTFGRATSIFEARFAPGRKVVASNSFAIVCPIRNPSELRPTWAFFPKADTGLAPSFCMSVLLPASVCERSCSLRNVSQAAVSTSKPSPCTFLCARVASLINDTFSVSQASVALAAQIASTGKLIGSNTCVDCARGSISTASGSCKPAASKMPSLPPLGGATPRERAPFAGMYSSADVQAFGGGSKSGMSWALPAFQPVTAAAARTFSNCAI